MIDMMEDKGVKGDRKKGFKTGWEKVRGRKRQDGTFIKK